MPATNVGARWNAGKLEFYDLVSGTTIVQLDGPNIKGVIPAGSTLDVTAGTALLPAGFSVGGTALTSSAADLNQIKGAGRVPKVAVVALAAVDTAGGIFSWANPEAVSIMITRTLLNVTTKSNGACTLDIGTTTVSGTTLSDTLIDGVDVGTATGLFSNLKNPGTNGLSDLLLATGKWVTGSMASGTSAGLVGFAYIEYILI